MKKIEELNFLEVMQNPTEDTRSRVMPRTTRLEIYAVENNLRPYLALQKIRFFLPPKKCSMLLPLSSKVKSY